MEYVRLVLVGIVLGVANVIPGVSGGTMAVVFNVYDRIMSIFCLDKKKILQNIPFCLLLAIGMLLGVLLFSKVVTLLLARYEYQTMCFFTGLIIGSIPLICRKVDTVAKKPCTLKIICFFLLGCAIIAIMMKLNQLQNIRDSSGTQYTELETMGFVCRLIYSGIFAAIAMIIPGVSGSLLLLAMGMYPIILKAVADLNIMLLTPFAFGVLLGIGMGIMLVKFLLAKCSIVAYSVILGLIVASAIYIFPAMHYFESVRIWTSCTSCLFFGFVLSFGSSLIEKKQDISVKV